jgi:quercetin dioxygenase-like cupin family protein
MQADITTEFETTEFAGITTGIINPYPSPFTILDMTIKPGAGAPAHISATEDKLFIVIAGQLKYLIGDRTAVTGPGARVLVPRGTVHGFTNLGDADARHILGVHAAPARRVLPRPARHSRSPGGAYGSLARHRGTPRSGDRRTSSLSSLRSACA